MVRSTVSLNSCALALISGLLRRIDPEHGQIHLEGCQRLSQLVVNLASDMRALLFRTES